MFRVFFFAFVLAGVPALAAAEPAVVPAAAAPAASASSTASPIVSPTPEPSRRADMAPAPMDPIFPNADFNGPLVGTNVDPTGYPLETALGKTSLGKALDSKRIRIYGWLNPGDELSRSSTLNTYPISYNPLANRIEIDQAVIRVERDPNTVQQDHADWGFRFSTMYGVDYRWTTSYGFTSSQLAAKNQLNGYDSPEAYAMLYEPHVFKGGTVFELGRVISIPDIEAQLAPQNYLYTHSLMFDFDCYTQTGLFAWSKLSPMFTLDYGVDFGNDISPGNPAQVFPTGELFLKYTDKSNRNSVVVGVDAYNNRQYGFYLAPPINAAESNICANYSPTQQYTLGQSGTVYTGVPAGQCLYGHDNLQQTNLTWYHIFNKGFHNAFEAYYLTTRNAPIGGTISNGPLQYSAGGGPGAFLPGKSIAVGLVDYLEYKFSPSDFVSFRTDYLNDPRGWRSGYQSSFGSLTLGVTHHFSPLTWIRPELRVEKAFSRLYDPNSSSYVGVGPYDNLEGASGFSGTKNYQTTIGVDLIQWF